jgi:hypothetical protein
MIHFSQFVKDNPVWLAEENASVPATIMEMLGYGAYEDYFTRELNEPIHRGSMRIVQGSGGHLDLIGYAQWLIEESTETEHHGHKLRI